MLARVWKPVRVLSKDMAGTCAGRACQTLAEPASVVGGGLWVVRVRVIGGLPPTLGALAGGALVPVAPSRTQRRGSLCGYSTAVRAGYAEARRVLERRMSMWVGTTLNVQRWRRRWRLEGLGVTWKRTHKEEVDATNAWRRWKNRGGYEQGVRGGGRSGAYLPVSEPTSLSRAEGQSRMWHLEQVRRV
ncbi:hypothetical protein BDN70DRAFT_901838 [Pholiota conissans]|uniref:Uncharacterized protein n=1 Tax=Pholiota conissans TaxID=109636 RepID=A0A9P5YJ48_9AGAR|nr:hypothetical protein BDN70DRAFT_901838 [Pholiota conissans]